MKAYVSDTEDLKQDPLCRETWDDMIIHVSFFHLHTLEKSGINNAQEPRP